MKKLIINQSQLAKLDEALSMSIPGEKGKTSSSTFADWKNKSSNITPGTNVTVQPVNSDGPLAGSTVNAKTGTTDSEVEQAYNDGAGANYVAESYSLTKGEVKVLSKLNENDRVYSKASFKKVLSEDYANFNTRLNNRRKTR